MAIKMSTGLRNQMLSGDSLKGICDAGSEIRIYSGAILKRTYSGIAGTSQTYTAADELADGGPFNPVRFVLDAQRDGFYSHQAHDVTVTRA